MLSAGQNATELYAKRESTVEILNLTVSQTPYNIKESGTDTEKLIKSFEDDYRSELEAQGFTVTSITQDKMTVAGKTCDGYIMSCTYGGVSMSMVQFFVFKGNYVMMVTTGSTSEGKAKLIVTNYLKKND